MTFVKQMLDLKAKFDRIIQESFRNEKKMQKKLKGAWCACAVPFCDVSLLWVPSGQ